MKRITSILWGANKELLMQHYLTTIRVKLMYGSISGSVALSVLSKLDPIQNTALRISIGAMKSSPIIAFHAESGIVPLVSYRRETLCQHPGA